MSGPNDNRWDPGRLWNKDSDHSYPPSSYSQPSYSPSPYSQPSYAQFPYALPGPNNNQHHPRSNIPHNPHNQQGQAPRQRTAIACQYCRRRKIRCSGYEHGQCTNCRRFNQACMFMPVSSAPAQAFVPLGALHKPHGPDSEPVVLYGAHGQPLPPGPQPQVSTGEGEYGPHGQPLPPLLQPQVSRGEGEYGAHGQPLPPGQQPQDSGGEGEYGPHGQPLPPLQQLGSLPLPQGMYHAPLAPSDPRYRDSNGPIQYPDPTNHNLAPVTPTSRHIPPSYSYPPPPPPPPPPPTHPLTLDRRSPSAYAYDARHSSSPHGSPYPPPLAPMTPQQVPPAQGIQSGSIAQSSTSRPGGGMTPPPIPTPTGSQRSGLNVRDMLNPEGGGRSSTDSSMLNALDRRGPQ